MGWLLTIWSSFAILTAVNKLEAHRLRTDKPTIIQKRLPAENRDDYRMHTLDRKHLGSLQLSACGLNRFWTSVGMAHMKLGTLSCGKRSLLS